MLIRPQSILILLSEKLRLELSDKTKMIEARPELCFTDLGWTYFNPHFSVFHISAQAYVVNRYKVICHRIIMMERIT